MHRFKHCGGAVRRAAVLIPVFLSSTAVAQEKGAFPSVTVGLSAGVLVLFLLLAASITLLFKYRRLFLDFSQKCDELQPELDKTGGELSQMTARFTASLEMHSRQLEESGAAMFKLNTRGECVYVNEAMTSLSGLSKQEILEQGLLAAVHPDDRERVGKQWKSYSSGSLPQESTYRLLRENGDVVHVVSSGSLMREKDRTVTGYLGTLLDVSAREHEFEEAQIAEHCSSRFIQQVIGGFYELRPNVPIEMDQPSEKVAALIERHMQLASCGSEFAAFCGQPADDLVGTVLKDLSEGCGLLEDSDKIRQFVDDGLRVLGEERIRSDHRGTPHCLLNDVVGMVEDGKLICIMGAQYDISAQKREKEQFEQQLAFFRRILNMLPGDVFVKDPRCRYVYVNSGFEKRTGIPVDDWKDKTVFEVLPAVSRDFNATSIEVMKSGSVLSRIDHRPGTDGDEWVETIENPLVSEDGVIEGVVGISIDVSDRSRREQELRQSEALFRFLVEHSPDGMMMADSSTKQISYANPAFCELFGYTEEEIRSLMIGDLHSPGSRRMVLDEWDERAQKTQRFEEALPCQRKDRALMFADVGVGSASLDGTEKVIGTYSDASARKKIETELEKQRDRQAGILRNASILLATVDSSGMIRSANDALLELLGRDEPELVGRSYVNTLVYKDDREQLIKAFAEDAFGSQHDCEYRVIAADGSLITVSCRVRARTDAKGFTVTGLDVTAQRVLEQQLREECGELRKQLAERESRMNAAVTAREESKHLCDKLMNDLEQVKELQAGKVKNYENDLESYRQREAVLNETIAELEQQKQELEEMLAAAQQDLAQQTEQREQLHVQLQQLDDQFAAKQKAAEAELRKKVSSLTEETETRRAREEELSAECDRLNGRMSELTAALEEQSQKLESLNSEQETRERELTKVRSELETRSAELESSVAAGKEQEQVLLESRSRAAEELKALQEKLDGEVEQRKQLEAQISQLQETFASEREASESELSQKINRLTEETEARRVHEEELTAECARLTEQVDELTAALEAQSKDLETRNAEQEALESELTQVRSELEARSSELESAVAAGKKQEKVLLESRSSVAGELKVVQKKLSRETGLREHLEQQIKQQREAFTKERETFESESGKKIGSLTQEVRARRSHEEELTAECDRLSSRLAELTAEIDERSQELARRSSEWEARENELISARTELEEQIRKQRQEIEKTASARSTLEKELNELQEAASAGQEVLQLRIKQQTDPLKKELEELRKREKQMKESQAEADRQLTELKTALNERSAELEAAVAARKEQEQALLETRRRLEEAVVQEKNRLAEQVRQFNEVKAESRDTEKSLRRTEAELQQKVEELEALVEQRTRELAKAADQRIELENQVAESREAAAHERDTVEDQIRQRTLDLKKQLQVQREQEDRLKAEQETLSDRLAKTQEDLDQRSAEVAGLEKIRLELEEKVELEKESLSHRVQLFKEEMQENRRVQQVMKEREDELQAAVRAVEDKLEHQKKKVAQEEDARRVVEQEVERLRKAVEAGGRRACELAEDLIEPLEPVLKLSETASEDEDLPNSARTCLKKINRYGQRMQSILCYQQELFSLENEGVHLLPQSLVLNVFLTELTNEFTEKANTKHLFFALSRSNSLPESVSVDPDGIRRVLDALFDHALEKTSGKGRVGLHVTCQDSAGRQQMVFLLVYSSMDQDAVMTGGLFDASGPEKSSREMTEEELRLSLTRRYAELMGGALCLQEPSELTKRLSFSLPIEVVEKAEAEPEASAEQKEAAENAHAI